MSASIFVGTTTFSMRRLRISAISYLNTAPLMWDFEHGPAGDAFDITYTLPSQCAMELERGIADVGIIPAAAYATIPALSVVPRVAIASKNAVRSILLVSYKEIDNIRSVALDSSSLTSVALTRILFEKWWGGDRKSPSRKFSSMAPNLDNMLASHDAALVIGDPALAIDRSKYRTWDLAEEWVRFTSKPFVFAFWAVRKDAAAESNLDLTTIFQQSRDQGLQESNLTQIVQQWSVKLGLPKQDAQEYLTRNIYYYLDEDCLSGLELFYRYAHEGGILPRVPTLDFVNPKPALIFQSL
jgi:Predicted periplasmic solute-binding protein